MGNEIKEEFIASYGWFNCFKVQSKVQNEESNTDVRAASDFTQV